jgi:hypothetical protein
MYAKVTIAISDNCFGGLEGFAPLSGHLPESVFHAAVEDGAPWADPGDTYAIYVDLMDGKHSQVGEKAISLQQAAGIVGLEPGSLVQLGRQRLAQIDNEADVAIRSLRMRGDR